VPTSVQRACPHHPILIICVEKGVAKNCQQLLGDLSLNRYCLCLALPRQAYTILLFQKVGGKIYLTSDQACTVLCFCVHIRVASFDKTHGAPGGILNRSAA
jgi:hypothetical protein